jgi:hypothetical protein
MPRIDCNCSSYYTCFDCTERAAKKKALEAELNNLRLEDEIKQRRPVYVERTVVREVPTIHTRTVYTDSVDPLDVAIGVGGGVLLARGAMALGEALFGTVDTRPSRKLPAKKKNKR